MTKAAPAAPWSVPGAVIVDPPAELRKEEHEHVIRSDVLLQVHEEVVNGLAHVLPQHGVHARLVGMGVKDAVVAVENSGTQIGQVNLGDALELSGYRGVGVLYVGGVSLRRHLQDICPPHRLESCLSQVIHNRVGPGYWGIDASKRVQGLASLLFPGDTGQKAVGL